MRIRLSDFGWNGLIPTARRAKTRNGNPAPSWIGVGLISVIAAGWMFVRAEAANPPFEPPARSAVSTSASLAPGAGNTPPDSTPSNAAAPGGHGSGIQESSIAPADTSGDAEGLSAPPAKVVASVDGMTLLRQSLRRGGLGSKALMTLTIRNSNDYPVKHIQLLCSFRSRDGYVTRRRHTINGVVKSNSRRTFRHMMVGFVSINANRAKCSLLSADWA